MTALVECQCEKCGQVWWIGQGQPRSGQRICPQCGIANQYAVRDCASIPELEAEVRRLRAALAPPAEAEHTAPLEEGELIALEALAGQTLDDPATDSLHAIGAWDTLRLIAEVRRLRAEWWKDHLMG